MITLLDRDINACRNLCNISRYALYYLKYKLDFDKTSSP